MTVQDRSIQYCQSQTSMRRRVDISHPYCILSASAIITRARYSKSKGNRVEASGVGSGRFFVLIRAFFGKRPGSSGRFLQKRPELSSFKILAPNRWVLEVFYSQKLPDRWSKKTMPKSIVMLGDLPPVGRPVGRASESGLLSHARPIRTGHPGSFPSLADVL